MDMETEENHGLPGFAQGYGAEGPDEPEIAREKQISAGNTGKARKI
jgi:hypothetical protein